MLIWVLQNQQKQARELLKASTVLSLKQNELLEKAFTQLRAADPWQYQQAMYAASPMYDENYDPSLEAEAARIADRQNRVDDMEDDLNEAERSALGDLFPGAFGN